MMKWTIDNFGKLTISGDGKIPDYVGKDRTLLPWSKCKDRISKIVIEEGIREIGVNAFRDCKELRCVILPDSLERIHAYAFWNCKKLGVIEAKDAKFRYYYEEGEKKEEENEKNIIFGLEAFYNVPWTKEKWGDYYVQDGNLYVCFCDKTDILIPEGVRILKQHSFSHIKAKTMIFPKTLEIIENFAFYGSYIERKVYVYNKSLQLEPYALADVDSLSFNIPCNMQEINLKRTNAKIIRRKYYPQYIEKYTIGLKKNKFYSEFRKMEVVKNHTIIHKTGDVTKVRDDEFVDIGKNCYVK